MTHSLVEQAVYRYPSPLMDGMRFYRIEYCGHAEECACEGGIWLPSHIDAERIEAILNEEVRR